MASTTINVTRSWTVPLTVTSIAIVCAGAAGGATSPGKGGIVQGTLAVTPGDVIAVVIGKTGGRPSGGAPDGRQGYLDSYGLTGGGGGGGTTVRWKGNIVVVAGGGGGGSGVYGYTIPAGGNGAWRNGGSVNQASSPYAILAYGATQYADGVPSASGRIAQQGGGGGGGWHIGGDAFKMEDTINAGNTSGAGGSSWYNANLVTSVSTTGTNAADGYVRITYTALVPPTTPTIVAPTAGTVLADTALPVVLAWTHHGDSAQLQAQVTYGQPGGATYIKTVTGDASTTPADNITFSSDWLWLVKTWSQNGLASPWTAITPFTVATPPAAPTVTAPASAGTVTGRTSAVSWVAPAGQQGWKVQVTTGGGTWESGEQGGAATSTNAPFDTQGAATVKVAVKVNGLWSPWTTVSVTVTWLLPAMPVLTVVGNVANAAIDATWTHPGGGAAVDHYDVWALEGGKVIQIAAGITATNATYWTPASGASVGIRVTVVSVQDTAVTVEAY